MQNSTSVIKRISLFTLLAFCLTFGSLQAQFTVSPDTVVSGTVYQNGYEHLQIDFANTTQSDLSLEWETVSNTFPPSWGITLCDYQSCFAEIIQGRDMERIPTGVSGFISISFNPGDTLGSGEAVFKVREKGNAASEVTVHFQMTSIVGIEDDLLAERVTVYPNPTSNQVTLRAINGDLDAGQLSLISLTGATVNRTEVTQGQEVTLNMRDLSPGVYFLHYETSNGVLTRKVFKTN